MNHTTLRFPRRAGEHRPCDALSAIALHRYTPPLSQRLFFAFLRWGWVAVLAAVFLLTGCDRMAAAHAQAVEQVAELQDREALIRREWAGQQVCGAGMTAVWESDQVLACYRNTRLAQGVGK